MNNNQKLNSNELFSCPICKNKKDICVSLKETQNSLLCENNHCFDKAKEGYYNFDLNSHSKDSGDSKEMCCARRDFLQNNFYYPLAKSLADIIYENSKSRENITIVDAGCGEGYYLRTIQNEIYLEKSVLCSGIDLAKNAIKLAAKTEKASEKKISYAVSSIFELPYATNSIDFILSIFAPVGENEAHRVLKDNSYLIVAGSGAGHLFELKSAIYDTPYKNEEKISVYDGFAFLGNQKIIYEMNIANQDIRNLFYMTPYFWKTSEKDSKKINSIEQLKITCDFFIHIYKKV